MQLSTRKMVEREIKASLKQCLHDQRYLSILRRYQKHPCWCWPYTRFIRRDGSVYQCSCSRNHRNTCRKRFCVAFYNNLNLNKDQLIELLKLATTNQLFQLDGKLYEQVEGVAMGSPLGPLLANTFVCYIEEKLEEKNELPSFYKRYVDDTFKIMPLISTKPTISSIN